MTRVHDFDQNADIPPFIRNMPDQLLPREPVGYLNDAGIYWAIKKGEIIIKNHGQLGEDNIRQSITPVGYDLRVGDRAVSGDRGKMNITITNPLRIHPGEHVVIWTAEDIRFERRIGATIHSRVRMVSRGLSHISTTIDPTWPGNRREEGAGRLGIHVVNLLDEPVTLSLLESFCTVMVYRSVAESLGTFQQEIRSIDAVEKELLARGKKAKRRRLRIGILLLFVSLSASGFIPYGVMRVLLGWPHQDSVFVSGLLAPVGGLVFSIFWTRR